MVIGVRAATPSSDDLAWSGRRHDDDKPGAVRGSSSADLFDTVFHALHDGEQVAVGFGGPLTTPVDEDQRNLDGAGQEDRAISLLDQAEAGAPGLAGLDRLLGELGKWRPWTAVSTSLPRWRATTSILVWELLPSSNAAGESDPRPPVNLISMRPPQIRESAVSSNCYEAALIGELMSQPNQ